MTVVRRRSEGTVTDGRPGRQWCLPLADRVLLVATHYRTNLTMRQLAALFGITTAAVHRIIDRLSPGTWHWNRFVAGTPATRC